MAEGLGFVWHIPEYLRAARDWMRERMKPPPAIVRLDRTPGNGYVWYQAVVLWRRTWANRGDELRHVRARLVLRFVGADDTEGLVFASMPEPVDEITLVPGEERSIPLVVRSFVTARLAYSNTGAFPVEEGKARITGIKTMIGKVEHRDLPPGVNLPARIELMREGEVVARQGILIVVPAVDDHRSDAFRVWLTEG